MQFLLLVFLQLLLLSKQRKLITIGTAFMILAEKIQVKIGDWINEISDIGCAEILITSIDKEGTKLGFDNELINFISSKKYKMPIMYSGGYGNINHINQVKIFR